MNTISKEITPDGLCVLTFDRPGSSANLLDRATLEELNTHLESVGDARGLIVISAKDSIFVAGADLMSITGMTHDDLDAFIHLGQDVFNRLAGLKIPTVAAIHGACVGGGCELALSCDWRAASPDRVTKIGLPETKLGLIPAWGGCTRLPRLISVPHALDIILGGKTLTAKHALKLGLVDDIAPRQSLLSAARKLIARGKHPLSLTHSAPFNAVVDAVIARKARGDVVEKTRGHYPAVSKALEVVLAGSAKWNLEDSLKLEREGIRELISLPTTRNLLGIFFQQEAAKKLHSLNGAPRMQRATVIGAGVMGAGIAQWMAARGLRVILRDIDAVRVAAGMASVRKLTADAVKARALSEIEGRDTLDRISPSPVEVSLRQADVIIEAAVEKMEVKKSIFRRLEELAGDDTLLATNTSALSITELAGALRRPERVVGIHFFNPVHKMQLVEVVTGKATSPEAMQRAVRLVQQLGKLPVVVRDSPGFLVNRILLPYLITAGELFAAGARVEDVDEVMLDFGMPMGPLRLIDEVGVDIAADVAATLAAAFPDRLKVPALLTKMHAAGLLGRKSGAGFYLHGDGGEARTNPSVLGLRESTEVLERAGLQSPMVLAMVNEAARCLEEHVVENAADVDFAMIMGTGWAPFRGGPLRYADSLGAAEVVRQLSTLAEQSGPQFAPCKLLTELAGNGRRFHENDTRP